MQGHGWHSQNPPLRLGLPSRHLPPGSAHAPFPQSAASAANPGQANQAAALATPELCTSGGVIAFASDMTEAAVRGASQGGLACQPKRPMAPWHSSVASLAFPGEVASLGKPAALRQEWKTGPAWTGTVNQESAGASDTILS